MLTSLLLNVLELCVFTVADCVQVPIVAVTHVGFPSFLQGKVDRADLRKAREAKTRLIRRPYIAALCNGPFP